MMIAHPVFRKHILPPYALTKVKMGKYANVHNNNGTNIALSLLNKLENVLITQCYFWSLFMCSTLVQTPGLTRKH